MGDGGVDDAPLVIERFDTAEFKPAERYEAWANRHWPAIGLLFQAQPTEVFFNRSMTFRLGSIALTQSHMGAQRYARRSIDIRRDDCDGLLIPVTLSGAQHGDTPHRPMTMGRGDLAFIDLSSPETHASTDSHTMLLAIPRTRAERAGIDVRAMHGLIVPASANQMFRRHLIELCRLAPQLTVGQAAALENATMDLLSVTLAIAGIGGTPASRAAETAKKQAVVEMIARDLGAPDLGVTKLIGAIGVSRTALYRLFEGEGGVQAYIRQQRLMRVRRELIEADPRERIADIAIRWGFDDAAHFSRLFRRQFGITPSEYRSTARRA